MTRSLVALALGLSVAMPVAAVAQPAASETAAAATGGVNDWSCRASAAHPEPVVVLHGLLANKDEDLSQLQTKLADQGYCTFSLTYGAKPGNPDVGGLQPISHSATQIAAFTRQVLAETGAPKVDLLGHSEGAFESLYVTKTQGLSTRIAKVVAIAPPSHGTTFAGLFQVVDLLGLRSLTDSTLHVTGCDACSDLGTGGAAIKELNNGPVAQPGVAYTIIASRTDELITPTDTAFVHEPGVTNLYVQDTCPLDPVGHVGEAYDTNVWALVGNALDPAHATGFVCSFGSPG